MEVYYWSKRFWAIPDIDAPIPLDGRDILLFRQFGLRNSDCDGISDLLQAPSEPTAPQPEPTNKPSLPIKRSPSPNEPPRKALKTTHPSSPRKGGKESWWTSEFATTIIEGLETMVKVRKRCKVKSRQEAFKIAFPGREWVKSTWYRNHNHWFGQDKATRRSLARKYSAHTWGELLRDLQSGGHMIFPFLQN
jgi:hypothetical protein